MNYCWIWNRNILKSLPKSKYIINKWSCKYNNISTIQIAGNCPTKKEAKKYKNISDKNKSSNVWIWVLSSSIIIIIILIIVGIIIYKKCYKKKAQQKDNVNDNDIDNDYFNIKGKIIKLDDEDEPNIGIN